MDKSFLERLFRAHQACPACPSPAEVAGFFTSLIGTLFADFAQLSFASAAELEKHVEKLRDELERILRYNSKKGANDAGVIADRFFADLPFLHEKIDQDITAMYEGDPAARSRSE